VRGSGGSVRVRVGGPVGHGHQRVEGVGLQQFLPAIPAGLLEPLVGERIQHGAERGTSLRGSFGMQIPKPLAIDVSAQPAALVQPPVGGRRVRVGPGGDSGAFLAQLRE
jgi:hypothetical protein